MDSYKKLIDRLVTNGENQFGEDFYKFGRRKSMNRLEAMVELARQYGVQHSDVGEAITYLDKMAERKAVEDAENEINNGRPEGLTNWVDGGPFPEYTRPIDMAVMLFSTMDVATSGTLKYSKVRGIPRWISNVNPGLQPYDRVKEHDIRAGLAEEIRRYKRERTDGEKKANHTFTVDEVITCRDSVTSHIRMLAKKHIAKDLAYDKDHKNKGLQELLKFVKIYNPPEKGEHSDNMHMLHLTMICHWIWQVKRRLNGLPTVYEIALIFLGRQGIGKSYTTKQMTSVVADLATPASVANLVDERETRRWENYYIAFLDEISKETKDSLSKLKDWVTKSESEFRPLYSNSSEACDKNAQAIGTSNFPLTSILKDPTGMRRFWEVPSDQEQNKLFENVDEIDWKLIYKSIDENHAEGYYGPYSIGGTYYQDLVKIQNSARDKTPVEEYFYTHNYLSLSGDVRDDLEKDWYELGPLKEEFNQWCQMNAWGEYTPKSFRIELQSMHLVMKRKSNNSMYVELNKPAALEHVNQIKEAEVGFNE